jgi:hypothetical protein
MSTNKTTPLRIENVLISLREMIFRVAKVDSRTSSPAGLNPPPCPPPAKPVGG